MTTTQTPVDSPSKQLTDTTIKTQILAAEGGHTPLLTGKKLHFNPTTRASTERASVAYFDAHPTLGAQLKQEYGYIWTWFMSEPDLKPLIITAGLNTWTSTRISGALRTTTWWKTTTAAQRNYQANLIETPRAVHAAITYQKSFIIQYAQSLGVPVTQKKLNSLATQAQEFGWTQPKIEQNTKAAFATANVIPTTGTAAQFVDTAKQLAGEYLIPITQKQLGKYVTANERGTLDKTGLEAELQARAAVLYPFMKTALSQGTTPQAYLSGWTAAAAKTLTITANDVEWTTPKWMKALMTQPTGKTGDTPVNMGVFQQTLMRTAAFGYSRTAGARNAAAAMATSILQEFGKVKTP